jgi:hypothetical protein
MSQLEVDKVIPQSGTTLTLGEIVQILLLYQAVQQLAAYFNAPIVDDITMMVIGDRYEISFTTPHQRR